MTTALNAISKTAYYTCAVRAMEAHLPDPVCNDTYAERFMTEEGKIIRDQVTAPPKSREGINVRHRIIDDLLRETLKAHPDTVILIVGCGFDSRAYRIPGGQWYEIDESPLIDLKNKLLSAAECGNALQRIGIDFASESLESRLPSIDASRNIVVIVEGVFYYLTEAQTNAMSAALRKTYPKHTLVCDLMDHTVATSYSKEVVRDIGQLGAKWISTPDMPVHAIEATGYSLRSSISLIEKILDHKKASRIQRFLVRLLLPKLIRGVGIYTFEPR